MSAPVELDDGLVPMISPKKAKPPVAAGTPKKKDKLMHATTGESVINREVFNGTCTDSDGSIRQVTVKVENNAPDKMATNNDSEDAESDNAKENQPVLVNGLANAENGRSRKRSSSNAEPPKSGRRSRSSTGSPAMNGSTEPRAKRKRGESVDSGEGDGGDDSSSKTNLPLAKKRTNEKAFPSAGNGDGPMLETVTIECIPSSIADPEGTTESSDSPDNKILSGKVSKVTISASDEIPMSPSKKTARKTLGLRRGQNPLENFLTKAEPKTKENVQEKIDTKTEAKASVKTEIKTEGQENSKSSSDPSRDLEDEPYSEMEKLFLGMNSPEQVPVIKIKEEDKQEEVCRVSY